MDTEAKVGAVKRPGRWAAIRGAFSDRNYAIYMSGNSISLIGWWVQRLSVGWLAWDLTHSSSWLGAVAFADLFPVVLIGPFGGVLADRLDRRLLLLACVLVNTLQAAALFVLTATGLITIEMLFALTLVFGITIGFQQPARLALIPTLVRPENVMPAVALNSVIFNTARFIGPAVAGIVLEWGGPAPSFLFNSLTYVAMITALLMLRLPPRQKQLAQHGAMLTEIWEGVVYIARHPAVGPMMALMVVVVLTTNPVLELLPGFADAVFGRGPAGLATLTSAVGIGAVTGGVWLAQRSKAEGLPAIAATSALLSGISVTIFAVSGSFIVGIVTMVAFGATMSTAGISVQTLVQTSGVDRMRGRVLSLWGLTFRGGPAIGAFGIGWAAEFFGLPWPVAAAAIVCILCSAVLLVRRKRIEAAAGEETHSQS